MALTTKPYLMPSQRPAEVHPVTAEKTEGCPKTPHAVEEKPKKTSLPQLRTKVSLRESSPLLYARSGRVRMTKSEWPLPNGTAVGVRSARRRLFSGGGEPYFEGVYLVSRTTSGWLDREGNVLCLCAQHSAMFQFGPKQVDEDIVQQVMQLKVKAEGGDGHPAVRMTLCGDPIEIRYAEKHLIDLQEMVRVVRASGH